jgi:threonine dehydrogenase-like Zn-dependent dehydrogenase
LLAALGVRLRGLEVSVYSRRPAPYLNSDLAEEIGARHVSAHDHSFTDLCALQGVFDTILEAAGFSPRIFEAARGLAKNGVLILSSVTGGDTTVAVGTDMFNQGFVLGNKVMVGTVNASRADFQSGVADLVHTEARFPGWLNKLLTTPVHGLEAYPEMRRHLTEKAAIKVYVQVADAAQEASH